jgi:hypothetical protein
VIGNSCSRITVASNVSTSCDRGAPCTSTVISSPTPPSGLHEEISTDYKDMIYAASREEIDTRRKAFIRKWRP